MGSAALNLLISQRATLLRQLAEIDKVMGKADRADYQIHKRKLKNGFVYYAQYYGEDGKRIKSKFSLETADETIAHSRAMEWREKHLKQHFDGAKKGGNFYAFLSGYYAEGSKLLAEALDTNRDLQPQQIKSYKSFIDTYFIPFLKQEGIKRLEDFKIQHIRQFQAYVRSNGIKPQTINSYLNGSVKKIYDHLLLNGLIKETPFPKGTSINLKVKKSDINKRNIFSISRAFFSLLDNRMWAMFKSEKDHEDWNPTEGYKKKHLLCLIGATTGLRVAEIFFLRNSSIVKKGGVHFLNVVNARLDGSGLKTESSLRMVPLHPITYKAIMGYIRENNITDYLFFKGQRTINYDLFKRANIECGIHCGHTENQMKEKNVVFYSFRHFYKTVLTNGGLPKELASTFMGHAKNKSDMGDNYTHLEEIGADGTDVELLAENGKKVIRILDRHFNDAQMRHVLEDKTFAFDMNLKKIEIESKEKNETKKSGKVKKTYTFFTHVIDGYEEFLEIEDDGDDEE